MMRDLVLQLADFELDRLGLGEAGSGAPADVDLQGRFVEAANDDDSAAGRPSGVLSALAPELGLLLADLIERDEHLLACGQIHIPFKDVVQVLSRDGDGKLSSCVAALVHEREGVGFGIPLGFEGDEPVLFFEYDGPLDERVRILTEVVRVLGDVVGFARLPDGLLGDAVRRRGEFAALLRASVRDLRRDGTPDADAEGDEHGRPGGEVSNFHDASVAAPITRRAAIGDPAVVQLDGMVS
jgi:hypothetical protein